MTKVYRYLGCLSVLYPVKVRCCKYRDKQITPTDRVSARCIIDHVSCYWGIVTRGLLCKWLGNVFLDYILIICISNTSGRIKLLSDYALSPFVFDHVCLPGVVALRWHISAGCHGNLIRTIGQGILHSKNQETLKSRFIDYCELSLKKCPNQKVIYVNNHAWGEPPKRLSVKLIKLL